MNEETRKATDFGADVFGVEAIQKYLSKDTAKKLLSTIQGATPLDPSIAGEVAHGMKQWALERGATHYTHWFLPLTGSTAEKHDAFLEIKDGEPILTFSGKNLIVGEPDASSFPSGGIRSTFEARGYTAWDPTSPAFIKRHANGATLCIPTAFCAYTGEALDQKTPLLRSMQTLSVATKRLMKCFGKGEARVTITLGPEQEYFLIDKKYYAERPDLVLTGRTLFGAPSPKGQQLEDHYFGSIRARILNFMNEVEKELWKLGIPAKTRHNEVAPAQFELAPMFEELNLSCDHNMLVMEVLRQVADRNGLVCLLHEKPFEGVNGSGKHCNWSIAYGGRNLLSPGSNPRENAIFITFLLAIIRAIEMHADILRETTAGAGNDHRLGANEAPPAIISVFLGDELNDVLDAIEHEVKVKGADEPRRKSRMRLGVDSLPALPKDTTDRNRTSPFAFTGNKFEFRAPGSSQNCAKSQMVLNTIVAESIDALCDKLDAMKGNFNENLQKLLRMQVKAHKRVIFSGDGYSDGWTKEAKRRGLPNLHDTMESLSPLKDERNIALFEKYGVLSRGEMLSRFEIGREDYERRIRIEAGISLEIARSMIRPVVADEFSKLATALGQAKSDGLKVGIRGLTALSLKLGAGLDDLHVKCDKLEKSLAHGGHAEQITAMNDLRKTVDRLEGLVDDARWPLPKYREMLFVY